MPLWAPGWGPGWRSTPVACSRSSRWGPKTAPRWSGGWWRGGVVAVELSTVDYGRVHSSFLSIRVSSELSLFENGWHSNKSISSMGSISYIARFSRFKYDPIH
eukprot:8253820-Pyramimonas_sp.AAC.1